MLRDFGQMRARQQQLRGDEEHREVEGEEEEGLRRVSFYYLWPFQREDGSIGSVGGDVEGQLERKRIEALLSTETFDPLNMSARDAADALRDAITNTYSSDSTQSVVAYNRARSSVPPQDMQDDTTAAERVAVLREFLRVAERTDAYDQQRRVRSGYRLPTANKQQHEQEQDADRQRRLPLFGGETISINTRDSKGETALHIAARANDVRLLAFLLSGVGDHYRAVELLLGSGGEASKETNATSSSLHPSPCDPPNLLIRNHKGQTALHVAAANGSTEAAAMLLAFAAQRHRVRRIRRAITSCGRHNGCAGVRIEPLEVSHQSLASTSANSRLAMAIGRLGEEENGYVRPLLSSWNDRAIASPPLLVDALLSSECAMSLTPLQHAAGLGHAGAVKVLLDVLFSAPQQRDGILLQVKKWLLPTSSSSSSGTVIFPAQTSPLSAWPSSLFVDALHLAATSGHLHCVKLMCAFAGHEDANVAAHKPLSRRSVAAGVNPDLIFARSSSTGQTVFHAAASMSPSSTEHCENADGRLMQFLLSLAADPPRSLRALETTSSERGKHDDAVAVGGGGHRGSGSHVSNIRMLLNEGDKTGATPLLVAASKGNVGALGALLQATRAPPSSGTAAAHLGGAENSSLLKSQNNETAADDADAGSLSLYVRDALLRTDCNGNHALLAAAKGGHGRAVRILLSAWGADDDADANDHAGGVSYSNPRQPLSSAISYVNVGNRQNGETALHLAALYGHTGVVRSLLLAGADLTARGYGGVTALHRAAQGGSAEAVRLLTTRVALPSTRRKENTINNNNGNTSAADSQGIPRPPPCPYPSPFDPNVRDAKGFTPLHTAVMHNSLGAAKALLAAGARIKGECDAVNGMDARQYANGQRRQRSQMTLLLNSFSVRFQDFRNRAAHYVYQNILPLWAVERMMALPAPPEEEAVAAENKPTRSELSSAVSSVRAEPAPPTPNATSRLELTTKEGASSSHSNPSPNLPAATPLSPPQPLATSSTSQYQQEPSVRASFPSREQQKQEQQRQKQSHLQQQREAIQQQMYLAMVAIMVLLSGSMCILIWQLLSKKEAQRRHEAFEAAADRAEYEAMQRELHAEWRGAQNEGLFDEQQQSPPPHGQQQQGKEADAQWNADEAAAHSAFGREDGGNATAGAHKAPFADVNMGGRVHRLNYKPPTSSSSSDSSFGGGGGCGFDDAAGRDSYDCGEQFRRHHADDSVHARTLSRDQIRGGIFGGHAGKRALRSTLMSLLTRGRK